MVVTRRAPAPPVPTSRTNSAQPIPRVKGKTPHTVPDVPSPLSNGTSRADLPAPEDELSATSDATSEKKGKGKQKGKHKKEKQNKAKESTTFVEFLTRIFLLWLTVYTLSVCPTDDKLKSPLCRGLHEYRKLVLEPYLLPPLQHAIAHPAVAPYVDRARPYVTRVIETTKPIALRAHHEWLTRVVPHWEHTVVPQWQKHVVPQWQKHVGPHIARVEQQLEPYLAKAHAQYERRLGPHVRLAGYNLHKWQQQARPYVVLAAHKTYDGYVRVKPYAIPVLQKLRIFLCQVSRFLGEQRRQFVDPHVKKIWERVNELSSGDTAPDLHHKLTASVSEASSHISSILVPVSSQAHETLASSVLSGMSADVETAFIAVPSTAASTTLQPVVPTPEVINVVPSVDPVVGASIVSSVASAAVSVASSVTEQVVVSATSLGSAASSVIAKNAAPAALSISHDTRPNTVPSLSAELDSAASLDGTSFATQADVSASVQANSPDTNPSAPAVTDEPASTTSPLVSTASAPAGQIVDVPAATPSEDAEDPDGDDFLAAFYAELGLDQDILNEEGAPETLSAEPAVQTESEEEKAEKLRLRKEETARKRAVLTARHSNWEKQIEEKAVENFEVLHKSLAASRKAAAQELKESEDIRQEVDGLVEEAEKFLKGAEKYMGQLRKESRSDEEKRTIWERVVEKVDKKFEERLSQTESVVNGWYLKVVEQEIQEVKRLAAEVKNIADRAQADVGLDYAYLDDVTYDDWQRYHDLDRRSGNFTTQAYSIQGSTDPSSPINPVLPAIQDLQNEVQDIVVGFETRLRRIKRNGERAFTASPEDPDQPTVNDEAPDEPVSILPIKEDTHADLEGDSPAAPPVVIGRSKEEILSALDRAAKYDAQATSAPEDREKKPEQIVESLAQEAVAEGSFASSPNTVRDEL